MGSNPLFWTGPNVWAAQATVNQQQNLGNGYMSDLDAANASPLSLDQIIGVASSGFQGTPADQPVDYHELGRSARNAATETGTIIEGECEEVKPAPLLTFDNP